MLGTVSPTTVTPPAEQLAKAFLEEHGKTGVVSTDLINDLCSLAVSPDRRQAKVGTDAVFRLIVEALGDRFEPLACDLYIHFFSRVIDYCRRLPQGRLLDDRLSAFGLKNEEDLLRRAERIRGARLPRDHPTAKVKKVLVLSRVTLGADVAVTSVVLSRMKRVFENAEILLVGGAKSASLFASDHRVGVLRFEYDRSASLQGRLTSWAQLAEVVGAELKDLASEKYVVVDPDSRLTQLGLLPITKDDASYCFFESRSYQSPGAESLAQLTGRWLSDLFGDAEETDYPYVSLSPDDRDLGSLARRTAGGRLAAVNLGVGDNPAKRLDDAFEEGLVSTLVKTGYTVLLDRGAGEEEIERSRQLTDRLQSAGKVIGSITATGCQPGDVITWQGSLSGFAGLIAASDLYVGYDSAGGHLAAAMGVAGIDIFAGAACDRMVARWQPWGPRPATVIGVREGDDPRNVLSEVQGHLP